MADRAAVLKQVDQETAELLAADTAALRAEIPEGDTVYNVTAGQIYRTTRGNAVAEYDFATIRYTAATALDSPIVHFSPDGRMAWAVARYRVTYVSKNAAGVEHPGELIDTWLAVYEKKNSRWVNTGLAQTFPPSTK